MHIESFPWEGAVSPVVLSPESGEPPAMPRFSHSEPSVEGASLPSAGVICTCGIGPEDSSSSSAVVVSEVVVVVVVVVPPTGTVSPTPTVVVLAISAPARRTRNTKVSLHFIFTPYLEGSPSYKNLSDLLLAFDGQACGTCGWG